MTDALEASSGPSLTSSEEAFFATGGESPISDAGSDTAGETSESVTSDGPTGDAGGKDTASDTKQGGEKAPQHVPLPALQEERARRKAAEAKMREFETQLAEFKGKFSVLDRLKAGAEPTETAPTGPIKPEDDVFGAVGQTQAQLEALQKQLEADRNAKVEAEKQAEAKNTFVNSYRADAATFEQKNPDYRQAYQHLLQSRAQELLAIGYDNPEALIAQGATPAEVQAAAKALHDAIIADEYAIADLAFKKGKSPAEIIYGLAKQRGYAAKPAAGTKAPAEEKLDAIAKGQQAHKSLNGTGGTGDSEDMTAERLVAMPLDEFEAWAEKNPAKARRLMGG